MTSGITSAKRTALLLVTVLASASISCVMAQSPAEGRVTSEPASDAMHAKSPALVDALDRAGELESAGRFGEIDAVLQPWAELGDPEVDFARAYALFVARMDGLHESRLASVDLAEVERLAERAAGNGHGGAMNLLYMIHGNGYGRAVDMPKAMEYLDRAAATGDIGARVNLATMLYEGRAWLPRDRERACRMFVDFATVEGAGAFSLYYLGLAILRGECGLDEDPVKGVEFIGRAAEGGVRAAERDFGKALEQGVGVERDIVAALKWYESAGSHGDGYALWRLGIAHVEGEGRAKDPARAVEYFRRAADAGSGDALVSLAVMHATGSGVEQDAEKAAAYYRQAADEGEPHAYRGLALMAVNGEGMDSDPVRAWVFYSQGVELGNAPEPELLAMIEEKLDSTEKGEAAAQFGRWKAQRQVPH